MFREREEEEEGHSEKWEEHGWILGGVRELSVFET